MNPSPEITVRLLLEVKQLRQEMQAGLQQAATLLTQSYQIAEQSKRIQAEATKVLMQMARTLAVLKKQRQQAR